MSARTAVLAGVLLLTVAAAACSSRGSGAGPADDRRATEASGSGSVADAGGPVAARPPSPAQPRVPRAVATGRSVATEVDLDLPRPEYAWWVGATQHEALVYVGSYREGIEYLAVVELDTGCVVGTHAELDAVSDGPDVVMLSEGGVPLPGADRAAREPADRRINSDAFREQLAALVELVSDFSARSLRGKLAWSADRSKILLAAGDWMYRSRDGGRNFTRIDSVPAYDPDVSADGRFGVYRRCEKRRGCQYRPTIVPLDSDGPPAWIGKAEASDIYLDPTGEHVYYARDDEASRQLCIDRSDTASRQSKTLGCVESDVNVSNIFFVSPGLRFAVLDVLDKNALRSAKTLWSLADGRRLRTVAGADAIITAVDDRGAFAWHKGISPDYEAHVSTRSGDQAVGPGDPLGWDPRGRLVVATKEMRASILGRKPGTLRSQQCGYIAAIDVDVTPAMTTARTSPARTRDQAHALALATLQATHPDTDFTLREETTGGGRTPPWVFLFTPASTAPGDQIPGLGPVLVRYAATKAELLRPHPAGLKAAVAAWERATYGHPQR